MATVTVRQGFMLLKTSRMYQPYRQYFFVLSKSSDGSRVQLEYCGKGDLVSSKKRTIHLETACTVERRSAHKPHAFRICLSGSHCMFACSSETDADLWVKAIRETISARGLNTANMFDVTVETSQASRKAKLAGNYVIEIASLDVVIWRKSDHHQETLQEILRCPISCIVDTTCRDLKDEECTHIISLQLASNSHQGIFFFRCNDGPRVLQAIRSRTDISDDLFSQLRLRRAQSFDTFAYDDHDVQERTLLQQQTMSYSCDNIFDNKPMNVASQPSGPPIPPRSSSPNDIYSSPRSFSSTGLVSRFQQGSLNTTELYCGARTISEETCDGQETCSKPPPRMPAPVLVNKSQSELSSSPTVSGSSSPASPVFKPYSPLTDVFLSSPVDSGPVRVGQPRTPCEKKATAKVNRDARVNVPLKSPILVRTSYDAKCVPEATTGPPTMPRPLGTLSSAEQAVASSNSVSESLGYMGRIRKAFSLEELK